MDIAASAATATGSPSGARTDASKSTVSSDFDTFLKLLTAQIRNQDPLEPADATAYTAQLATFSNVEQAVKTNDLLTQMIGRLDSQQISGATDWIGMDVRHSGPVAHAGETTELFTNINASADRAQLVVRDTDGTEVARTSIDPDAGSLRWPAIGQGASVAPGLYSLQVESWAGDQELAPTPVDHYAQVGEVVLGASGTELILQGGARLAAGELQAIRRPD